MYVVTEQQDRSFMMKREGVSHGDHLFPLKKYDVVLSESFPLVPAHWHEEAEILFVTEGMMELVVDGISIIAGKDTIVLIPPNQLHGAYQYRDQTCRFTSIVFHPDFISSKNQDAIQAGQLNPFFENSFVSSYVIYGTDLKCEAVQHLLGELTAAYHASHPYRELLIKGYLYQILFHLLIKEEKHNIKSTSDYINEERKKKILRYIDENYQNPLNLDSLAKSVSLSREQFCRFFKKSFRSTPVSYLNRYRINRSMSLLRETGLPVIDIALAVGFDSSNYFAVSFRKATGMTPSQFRNMT